MSNQIPSLFHCFGRGSILAALLAGIISSSVFALPDDQEQPIHITADQALRDEKGGFTVYSGNVQMSQGSLHISADKITIFRIVEEADKIVARGTPAQLQQQPDPEKGLVYARANVIEYYKMEARIHLRKDAQIEQDGSSVTGETIDYYINEQLVKAGSNRSREDSRVQVVIPAQSLQNSEANSGATDSK
jgi:lipopolysaccharide export system protein LptA